jgi:multiple sugar transport system permease protein
MPTRQQRLLLLAPLALLLVPFFIWPAMSGFLGSFTDYVPSQVSLHFVGLDNYASILADSEFVAAWRNIALFALFAVPAELLIGFAAAFLMREPFRGRGLLRVVLLIPWLVSPIANGLLWHFLLDRNTGLLNFGLAALGLPLQPSPLGLNNLALPVAILTDIWRKWPLVNFLLLPGLLSIPNVYWEQATIEGVSIAAQIRHIALPWLRPLLLTIALLLLGDTLGTFDSIQMLTGGGPGTVTLTPALYSYQKAFKTHDWPLGVTSAWLVVVAVLLVGLCYLLLLRREVD